MTGALLPEWRPTGLRSPMLLLWAAVAVYALLQVVTGGLERPLRWDEAVYLAQVTPGTPDAWFGAHRSRGMTAVILPAALAGASLTAVRVWMLVVSCAALALAFRPWVRLAGWTGSAAAMVAAVGWVPVYFGVELYPNLLAGLAAVATCGHLLAWVRDRRRADLVATVVGLAAVAMLRPSESVWLAAALTVVLVIGARWRAGPGIGALLLGGFVGWLPWLVEAVARFGGPFQRLAEGAGSSVAGESRNSLIQYLNLVEGPVRAVVADPVITVRAAALLLGLVLLGLLGAAQRLDADRRLAAVVAGGTGAAMLVPYLVLNAGVNLRYITPALLLLAVPIGAGLVTVAGAVRRSRSVVALVLVVGLVVVTGGWQLSLARSNAEQAAVLQSRAATIGAALDEVAGDEPCAFVSTMAWPEIQWHTGCLGDYLLDDGPTMQCPDSFRDMAALAEQGHRVYVVAWEGSAESTAFEDWPSRATVETAEGSFEIRERPDGLGPLDPPTPADPADGPDPCPVSRAPDVSEARLQLRWERPGPA